MPTAIEVKFGGDTGAVVDDKSKVTVHPRAMGEMTLTVAQVPPQGTDAIASVGRNLAMDTLRQLLPMAKADVRVLFGDITPLRSALANRLNQTAQAQGIHVDVTMLNLNFSDEDRQALTAFYGGGQSAAGAPPPAVVAAGGVAAGPPPPAPPPPAPAAPQQATLIADVAPVIAPQQPPPPAPPPPVAAPIVQPIAAPQQPVAQEFVAPQQPIAQPVITQPTPPQPAPPPATVHASWWDSTPVAPQQGWGPLAGGMSGLGVQTFGQPMQQQQMPQQQQQQQRPAGGGAHCPSCGAGLAPNAHFCAGCGTKVG